MAFYKRRVVAEDTPEMIHERQARSHARQRIGVELIERYPDMGTRVRSMEEMKEVLAWQDTRFAELVRQFQLTPEP